MPGLEPEVETDELRTEDTSRTWYEERMATQGDEAKQEMLEDVVMENNPRNPRKVHLRVGMSDYDTARVYRFSEAIQIGAQFQQLALKQCSDPESWFSLFELRKVGWPDPQMRRLEASDKAAEFHFESVDQAIKFMEDLFKHAGYEAVRRKNFNDAAYMDPEGMAQDMAHMVATLVAEHDWETSVLYYRTKGEQYSPPKYFIVEDKLHTPQTKVKRHTPKVTDYVERTVPKLSAAPVEKRLDFTDVDSDSTISPQKQTTSLPQRQRGERLPVVSQLLKLVAAGEMDMKDMAKVVVALQASEGLPREGPQAASRSAYYEDEIDEQEEFLSSELPYGGSSAARHVTTVLQNVSIRTFDGARGSPEESRVWLNKLIHAANISQWSPSQRLDTLANNLANPARNWFKQLPRETQKDWNATKDAFYRKYCTDHNAPRQIYYQLTQKTDELASNYLYRLNTAARRAGVDYERRHSDLKEHIKLFFNTIHDKAVQMLRFHPYASVKDLDELLIEYETSQVRSTSKKSSLSKKVHEDVTEGASVSRLDGGGRPEYNGPRSPYGGGRRVTFPDRQAPSSPRGPLCEERGKSGHDKQNCWRSITCEYCGKAGHPVRVCREFTENAAATWTQLKEGAITSEEAAKQLNV